MMTIEQNIFKCATVVFSRLEGYGFTKSENIWVYNKTFMNSEFRALVRIDVNGHISGDVYETDGNEIYLPLRIESMSVGFAGLVRAEYEKILRDIKTHCCLSSYFVHPQSNLLAQRIYEKYGDSPCFPWKTFDDYGVFKNPYNNKWYALIMNINASKLNKRLSGKVEVINIKLNKDKIPQLITQKGFYPAYHMNKKNWITIILDGSVHDDLLFSLLDESHSFTLNKSTKDKKCIAEWIVPANPQYFDIETAFEKEQEIIWKQSNNIKVGDIVYMYVGAPISAILYQCKVTEANIPYDFVDENIKITQVMRIKQLKKYSKNLMPFSRLKELGICTIRGPRACPQAVVKVLEEA